MCAVCIHVIPTALSKVCVHVLSCVRACVCWKEDDASEKVKLIKHSEQ